MAITYRGTTLPLAKHDAGIAERAIKQIAYPAVDGTEEMHMGKRQKRFRVSGRIVDLKTGAFKKSTIEAWNDTKVGTLDIHGDIYEKVRMASANFSNCFADIVTGKLTCEYQIEFRQLRE